MTETHAKALGALADTLSRWMADSSWPLWSGPGRHPSSRFHEVLHFDGAPRQAPSTRVRTQARQVFSFALAGELEWNGGAEIVRESLPLLLSSGLGPDGVAGRRIDIGSGELLDDTADLYDTAFCLLAIAQSRGIVGADETNSSADKLLASIDAVLKYEDGQGYRETLPVGDARLQNPHMHFFESLLLLYDKTGRNDIWERAEKLYEYVAGTFFDETAAVVRESTTDDQGTAGYEPGHSMEWVWLIGYRARLGQQALSEFAYQLYDRACAAHREHGWTCLHLDDDNRPIDGSARLWSQTETLKAHLCIAELGDGAAAEVALQSAVQTAQDILDFWLRSDVQGGWLDHFDSERNLLSDVMPASTGYHLYLSIAELMRVAALLATRSY